ncbi:uncharacterized protein LOC129599364 [Paramacrobiotus metropolitanus]|uniref:uncharacterized protein LOC129599364 n=1 Tax=Paramacrobiotus metropolitanus TaxID=2943436 RepID=UPI002445ADD9|nr:uncharacterized protein LOC129599364 [Paramacrobiotus metropolitanus]
MHWTRVFLYVVLAAALAALTFAAGETTGAETTPTTATVPVSSSTPARKFHKKTRAERLRARAEVLAARKEAAKERERLRQEAKKNTKVKGSRGKSGGKFPASQKGPPPIDRFFSAVKNTQKPTPKPTPAPE